MYYYIKKGRSKIVHLCSCFHISNTHISDIASFNNIAEAEAKGYRVCKHCAGLKKYFNSEKIEIARICKENGISVNNKWAFLYVNTVYGQWKILFDEDRKCLQLYHRNSYENGKPTLIPHYHYHDIIYNSISKYLIYIIKHDEFRHKNPLHIKQGKPKKPTKGTNAWNKYQKKNKHIQKKRAIYNVLNLIDNLCLQSQSC